VGVVARNAEYALRIAAGARPELLALQAVRPSRWWQIMRSESVACIEGFPRSANSYAVEIFRRRNGQVPLAHHLHVPGQILRAAQLKRPCAMVIRRPLDALSSLLIVDERLSADVLFWSYIDFHRRVWPARDAVVVCEFDEVIADASVVSRRMNEHFQTDFDDRRVDAGECGEALRWLESGKGHTQWLVATPHPEKERLKANVREILQRHSRLSEAELWYDRWAARAGSVSG
jgi:hypothetical protein